MKKKKKPIPQTQRINFGNRTRYRPEKDDVPVHDRGGSSKSSFRPSGLDDYADLDEDEKPFREGYHGDW